MAKRNLTIEQLARRAALQRKYYAAKKGQIDQELLRGRRARYRERHPDRVAACVRRVNLRIRYGITLEQYDELLTIQCRRCAICGTDDPAPGRKLNWHIDHDHRTGRVRGLLCQNCNHGLGRFGDDVDKLKAAIQYLSTYTRKPESPGAGKERAA